MPLFCLCSYARVSMSANIYIYRCVFVATCVCARMYVCMCISIVYVCMCVCFTQQRRHLFAVALIHWSSGAAVTAAPALTAANNYQC